MIDPIISPRTRSNMQRRREARYTGGGWRIERRWRTEKEGARVLVLHEAARAVGLCSHASVTIRGPATSADWHMTPA
jgi:hypothetical protein